MVIAFFILGLLLVLCLIGLAIIKVLEARLKKKELRKERESFGIQEPGRQLGHIGYVENKYALIHKESSKIIISAEKSKVIETLQKMYSLELTSVDVSSVTGFSPFGTGRMENMVLLSYKLEREGFYKLIELNKE
ncbi:putative membrane protein [Staphylococcus phage vB_SauM_LM12]|nr:putative membrane protein [Staphylococcus phage vB_SauM_LM12]